VLDQEICVFYVFFASQGRRSLATVAARSMQHHSGPLGLGGHNKMLQEERDAKKAFISYLLLLFWLSFWDKAEPRRRSFRGQAPWLEEATLLFTHGLVAHLQHLSLWGLKCSFTTKRLPEFRNPGYILLGSAKESDRLAAS